MNVEWQNNYFDEVEEILISSAKYSYEENLRFSYKRTEFESRLIEYLIVINIAKRLFDWGWHKLIHVQLEYRIKDFYNGAFPEFSMKPRLKRKNHNPIKNKSGRIDIALTKEPYRAYNYRDPIHKSLIGIEVKSFSNGYSKIKEDIVRLSEAMVLIDEIGENSIRASYLLFYKKLDKPNQIVIDDDIPKMKNKVLIKWEATLEEYRKNYTQLVYDFQPIEVKEAALAELKERFDPDFFDHDEVAENSGLVMCYLIKIKRKNYKNAG
ncbi:hypothetical protein [Maribacter stanieri]|uniref:hypothetical protein n=1 Tax=Maribacter stanieri TaxID=440514 RepID=UPI0030DD257B|tara:strand:- start:8151 stop:8948 length:798 start_codon:yes stop_codon:yes gene_type:complete